MLTHRSIDWPWMSPATKYLFIGYSYLATTKPDSMINLQLPYHIISNSMIQCHTILFSDSIIQCHTILFLVVDLAIHPQWICFNLIQFISSNGSVSILKSYSGTYFSLHNSKILRIFQPNTNIHIMLNRVCFNPKQK